MVNNDSNFLSDLYFILNNLFKERYINSVKGCEYLNKLINSCKNNGLTFLKNTMYMPTFSLMLQKFTKEKKAHRTPSPAQHYLRMHSVRHQGLPYVLKHSREKLLFRNLMFAKVENMQLNRYSQSIGHFSKLLKSNLFSETIASQIQSTFTCSNSAIITVESSAKYAQN